MSENKEEIIKFLYFSESGCCGVNSTSEHHETYCEEMIRKGYTLVNVHSMGNLDDRRDSYEGTLIYHWKLKKVEVNRGDKNDMNQNIKVEVNKKY